MHRNPSTEKEKAFQNKVHDMAPYTIINSIHMIST